MKESRYIVHNVCPCVRRAPSFSTCITWPRYPSPCPLSVTTVCSWSTRRTRCESSCTRVCVCLCPRTTPCSSTTPRSEPENDAPQNSYVQLYVYVQIQRNEIPQRSAKVWCVEWKTYVFRYIVQFNLRNRKGLQDFKVFNFVKSSNERAS